MLTEACRSSNATTPAPLVRVVEVSDDHLLVRWVEPGKCHYGEQKWRLGVASRNGYCLLSNRRIGRGEPAYRPTGRPRPRNYVAMIAVTAIEALYMAVARQID
ncbi:DUF3331 domain-containing protein [Burkholderia multivorans]|uniref:DUF3331 domain-containing protein n=1 Tax=Burkholderia multivorans TaxID=87883 RepID=UPI000D007C2E|nr:DUF3331 domain-containing protein [Burkholderia multivorans]MDN7865227.1 DUF3331 domain-containing protein [Burkholderia multivorans]PRE95696.1 hypothetical protein C6Q05_22190 [Burkholderia multivorans]